MALVNGFQWSKRFQWPGAGQRLGQRGVYRLISGSKHQGSIRTEQYGQKSNLSGVSWGRQSGRGNEAFNVGKIPNKRKILTGANRIPVHWNGPVSLQQSEQSFNHWFHNGYYTRVSSQNDLQ
ncbi:hypothetical protein SUGI_0559790 [Cryptomeria japonica]|nr:hypothetical protein SUGI_0559790 [Cryptomeria japonica]